VVERIWALRLDHSQPGMRYADFALFLLAEEDKQSDASVQYWFHVLDYDGADTPTLARTPNPNPSPKPKPEP
jgi:hypothetical protein